MGVLKGERKRSCLPRSSHDVDVVRHQTKPDDGDSMDLGAVAEQSKVDVPLGIGSKDKALAARPLCNVMRNARCDHTR